MLPRPFLTATLATARADSGYQPEALALETAHASPTSLQLCFAPRPTLPRCLGASASTGQRWAIVLAGGNGTRLAQLTSAVHGSAVPKQYCSLSGERSLLADTVARARRLVARERVLTVVVRDHDPADVIVQPCNRGTAAGVLLPLLAIAARDPLAQVMLLPSDHFVADEPRLAAAMHIAREGAALLPDRVVVLGIAPDAPEPGYGWILPDTSQPGLLRPVRRFVEKPDATTAAELMRAGAAWNSFVLAGTAQAFLDLYRRRIPVLLAAFLRTRAAEDHAAAARLYATLPDHDFCRSLLQGSEDHLALHVARACGWTDLGTPDRVAACAAWLTSQRGTKLQPGSLGAAALRATAGSCQ
jgi:mannose-1-phosphate guanylyltransferase